MRKIYRYIICVTCLAVLFSCSENLDDMQEKHTEMKAFLMRYQESLGGNDFFASLSLDI